MRTNICVLVVLHLWKIKTFFGPFHEAGIMARFESLASETLRPIVKYASTRVESGRALQSDS